MKRVLALLGFGKDLPATWDNVVLAMRVRKVVTWILIIVNIGSLLASLYRKDFPGVITSLVFISLAIWVLIRWWRAPLLHFSVEEAE